MKNNLLFVDDLAKHMNVHGEVADQLSKNFSGPVVGPEILNNTPQLKLNSEKFRSDEFTSTHDGKHFLFSGCSTTYGVGLLEEEVWTSRLIKLIENSGEKISGHFNLAKPGTGVFEIVSNIFKYFDRYGLPDSVFVQIPNITRFYAYDKEKQILRYADLRPKNGQDFLEQQQIYVYQYLMMLETFCKINNIGLVVFPWSGGSYFSKNKKPDLESFYVFSKDKLESLLKQNASDNHYNQNTLTARDGVHHGTAYHEFWAREAFILYNELKKEK